MSDDTKPQTATGAMIQVMEDVRRSQMYEAFEKAWTDGMIYGSGFLIVNAYGEIHYMTPEEVWHTAAFVVQTKGQR